MADEKSYKDGLIEGRLSAIDDILRDHKEQLENHSSKISNLERVAYIVMGTMIAIQIIPELKGLLS